LPVVNSNLVNVAVALSQQASNSLWPHAFAVHAEAVRLIGVASNYLVQAQSVPPIAEPTFDVTGFTNDITALQARPINTSIRASRSARRTRRPWTGSWLRSPSVARTRKSR
jgi:hypothetical protein